MILLRAFDYRRMPWKNGGGETIEIAVEPKGAALDAFDWRVSMARVASDGGFSEFPGVDRTLAILEGEGIALSVAHEPAARLTLDTPPFSFPADMPTAASLIGGPVIDFNVMTRRGVVAHTVSRRHIEATETLLLTGDETLVYCANGAARLAIGEEFMAIAKGDTIRLSQPGQRLRVRPEAAATLLLVEFSAR